MWILKQVCFIIKLNFITYILICIMFMRVVAVFRQNQLFIPNLSTFQWIIFIFLNITYDINDLTRKKKMLLKLMISTPMSLILSPQMWKCQEQGEGLLDTLLRAHVWHVGAGGAGVFLHQSPYSSSHDDCESTCLHALWTKEWCVAAVFQDTSLPWRAWWKPSSTAGDFWTVLEL